MDDDDHHAKAVLFPPPASASGKPSCADQLGQALPFADSGEKEDGVVDDDDSDGSVRSAVAVAVSMSEVPALDRLRAGVSLTRAYCCSRSAQSALDARRTFRGLEEAVDVLHVLDDQALQLRCFGGFVGEDKFLVAERLRRDIKSLHEIIKSRGAAATAPTALTSSQQPPAGCVLC